MSAQVLVVDDEPMIRDVLAAWLGHEGYECSTVGGVTEALDRVTEGSFDVALLDLMLPDGDGVSLARRLRETDDDLELIMATGMRRFDLAVEGMRLNVMDYLLKPFTRQQLVDTVDRAVRRRAVTRHERTDRAQIDAQIGPRAEEIARSLNRAAQEATLDALLVALHTRNPEAATHAHRVARMAVTLGMQLGLPEAELAVLQCGALLHDIGKIAMPDALMCRPGPLTKEEIEVIRTHPEVGHTIISVVPSLQRSADIVLASHEAWDGSGYPRGLAGTDIPLGARITAVTDTFDALTWSRVYREPVSLVRAAAELVRCAGTQFDPDIVHSWLRVLDVGHPTVQ
jgi:response regulator RpfG family c-di-GMP phosphodiesterase